jgi:pimeloyl-ACP methyl ester carboxylesterase
MTLPMPDLTQSSAQVGGLRVSYLSSGAPVRGTLVLLHGSGLTARTWTALIGLLGPDYRCVAPDLRGHGDTDWPAAPDYDLADFGSDVIGLLHQLDVRRPVLVGMSLGGLIALHLAAGGFAADALVLVDCGPRMVARPAPEFLRRHSYPSLDEAVAAALRFNPRRSADLLSRSLAQNMVRSASGAWSWKWDPRRIDGAHARRTQAEDLWAGLAGITCPTLVVRGADSETFPRASAEELRAALPHGVLDTVNGAGHNVQGDNPVGLAASVSRFLASLGS